MTETAEPFRSAAKLSDGAVKVLFRGEEPGDRNYILGSWNAGWRHAPECRNLRDGRYARLFQDAVVGGYGALQADGTKVLVGASPNDRKWIWAFCVFTTYPGEAPVIHWLHVRPTLRDGRKTMSLRRLGVATRMLGTGGDLGPGVTDRLVYTCRPGAPTARECQALEADLLEGCKKIGVTAAHFPLERWLTP